MSFKKSLFIRSNKGASLIQVMIASAIAGVVGMLIVSMMQNFLKMNKQLNVKANAIMIKQSLVSTLQNSDAWESTISENTIMGCLLATVEDDNCGDLAELDELDANKKVGTPFVLRDVRGNAIGGFTSNGAPCTGFVDPTSGGDGPLPGVDSCPFGAVFKFLPKCKSLTDCIYPLVRVTGLIYYNPSKRQFPYNAENNRIELVRSSTVNTVKYMCDRFSGTYDEANKLCDVGGPGTVPVPQGPTSCKYRTDCSLNGLTALVGEKINGAPFPNNSTYPLVQLTNEGCGWAPENRIRVKCHICTAAPQSSGSLYGSWTAVSGPCN